MVETVVFCTRGTDKAGKSTAMVIRLARIVMHIGHFEKKMMKDK